VARTNTGWAESNAGASAAADSDRDSDSDTCSAAAAPARAGRHVGGWRCGAARCCADTTVGILLCTLGRRCVSAAVGLPAVTLHAIIQFSFVPSGACGCRRYHDAQHDRHVAVLPAAGARLLRGPACIELLAVEDWWLMAWQLVRMQRALHVRRNGTTGSHSGRQHQVQRRWLTSPLSKPSEGEGTSDARWADNLRVCAMTGWVPHALKLSPVL
jgi:hypothetical protein